VIALGALGGEARFRRYPGPDGGGPDAQVRYRRRGEGWEAENVTAAELRRVGLVPWPEAVGVWWPEPGAAGAMVCRPCVTADPAATVGSRADDDQALVLRGVGALQRVERRCALHTGRFIAGGDAS
jgi:hypothetical protein